MNLKNLLKLSTIVMLMTLVFSSMTFAQTTVFVDNTPGIGNDFNNGLSAASPKATIGSALAAFPSGTVIKVKGTGLLYNETVDLGTYQKEYTLSTYDSTSAPTITALVVNLTTVAAPYTNEVTFTGPFVINSGLTLTAGDVLGAGNLTVKTAVVITEGTVDTQLLFSGSVDFTYNGANDRTTGGELPAGTDATHFGSLTLGLTVAKTITFNESKIVKGTFTSNANSTLDLGGNTVTLTKNVAHANTGAITASSTGGVIVDLTNGNASFANAGALPNVTAKNGNTLTIGATTSIGSLTADSKASITLSTAAAATIDNTKGTGNIKNLSEGIISYTGAGGLAVKGNVEQSGSSTTSNKAQISFGGGAVAIDGSVTNSAVIAISQTTATPSYIANILFNSAAHVIKGSVNVTGNGSITTTTGTVANVLTVEFAATGAVVTRIDGGISNSATLTLSSTNKTEITKSGSVLFTARTSGDIGTSTAGQSVDISNTSSITKDFDAIALQNGAVDLDAAASLTGGVLYAVNVVTSGADGGYINLGRVNVASVGAINISGNLSNLRTTGNGVIVDGSTGAVAIGGQMSISGSKIRFTGALTAITVTGVTSVSGGTIEFPGAVNATSFSGANGFVGGVTLTGGTLDVSGSANITANVVSGSLTLTGGTLTTGTGARTWTTTATTHTIGGTTGNTTISPNTYLNGTEFIFTTPSIAQQQIITINGAVPVIPGKLSITNATALLNPTVIKGGNLRVLGDVTFNTGAATRRVQLDGTKLIVGQSLGTPLGNGSFINTTGFETINNGAVSMNGGITGAGANATQGISGVGNFGNLEIDVKPGIASAATPANAITLKGNLYLTRGTLDNSGFNVTFDNTVTTPSIIRNAGIFNAAPAYTAGTTVNVVYIGTDKTASYEMQSGVTGILNDLTVATTDGSSTPGKGTVAITGAVLTGWNITVKGTLTVNAGQALLITGGVGPFTTLTVKGSNVVLDGDIANDVATNLLIFGSTTGTTITGAGWLPNVNVLATSVKNVINGSKGLITGLLGADGVRSSADDYDTSTLPANGSLTYGAGAAGLKVMFGAGAKGGTQVSNITTSNTGNTLEIAANLVQAGALTHSAGTITIDSSYTWKYTNTAAALTGKAVINGKGWLIFTGNAATPVTITGTLSGTSVPTIDAPVQINLTNNTDVFATAATKFVLTNSLKVTQGVVNIPNDLTLTGNSLTVETNGSFNSAAAGTLILKAAVPPMTWTYTGTPTMGKVTVSADVNLAGDGTALTVNGLFTHNGGNFGFGDKNITVAGGFTRTNAAGTYSAGKGYLIFTTTAAIDQASGFSIPNLRFGNASAVGFTLSNASGAGVVTVTKNLYVDNAAANTITLNGKLAVANGADVYYSDGKFDAVPTYGSTINLHVVNTAGPRTIDATVWPATAALVQLLEVNNGANTAVLPGARQINTTLTLTSGTLDMSAAAQVLTVKNNSTINVVAGKITATAGSISYGTGNTVNYLTTAYYKSGLELPATVKTLNISRNANAVNSYVLITSSVTVTGDLTVKNNLATSPQAATNLDGVNPAVAVNTVAIITLKGDLTITKDAFALATDPETNFGSSLAFAGQYNQTITVPSGGSTIGDITINTSSTSPVISRRPKVILAGGNLETGMITFVSGIFEIPSPLVLTIPAPTLGNGQGFVHEVADGFISHVVGKVAKKLVNFGTLLTATEARSEFPVGSETMYRPVAITFNPAFGAPTVPNTTITVSHADSSAGGAAGLPIKDGVAAGIDVSRYPAFYWFITSSQSLSNSVVFDLELQATGFTDFDDINNVRMIRRYGTVSDITNQWLLQGLPTAYDNSMNLGVPTIIQKGTFGGLRNAGAVFTLGMTSKMSVANPIASQTLIEGGDAKTVDLSNVFTGNRGNLTFSAQSSNATKVTVSVKDAVLTLTPVVQGEADITVVASDAANTDFYATTFHVTVEPLTDVKTNDIPKEFALMQNYPNPFNPTTNIKFDLPKESNVTLKVYNILGEEVTTLVNTVMPAGHQEVKFDATRFASGLYIYRIQAGSFVQVKKMMLMK